MEKQGSWPEHCEQRAFVEGAQWWQFHSRGSTMFPSERDKAEAEAIRRFGLPKNDELVSKAVDAVRYQGEKICGSVSG